MNDFEGTVGEKEESIMRNFGKNSPSGGDPFSGFVRSFSEKCSSFWQGVPILGTYYPSGWSTGTSRFGTSGQLTQGDMMKKAAIWLVIGSIFCWALEWFLNGAFLELEIPRFGVLVITKVIYFSMVVPVVFQLVTRFNGDSRIVLITLLSPVVFIGAVLVLILTSTGSLMKTAGAESFKTSAESREDFTNPTGTFAESGDMVTQTRPVGSNTFTSSATPDFSKLEKKKSLWDRLFGFKPDGRFKR